MTKEHPITPPPELVQQWIQGWYDAEVKNGGVVPHVATQAARWGRPTLQPTHDENP